MPDSVAPDLSSLNQPGVAAAPSQMESVAPPNLTQANLPAYGEEGAPAQPSTVVPAGAPVAAPAKPMKHQVLAAMVTGLADALSAAGTSLATKGQKGGAEMVQELQAQRQQARQSAQAAAEAQKSAEIENASKVANTSLINAKTHELNETMPDEVAQSHMKTASETLDTQLKAQTVFDTTGRVPTGWSADPSTGQVTFGGQAKPNAVPGTPAVPGVYDRRAGILLDSVGKELADEKGNEDPSVTAARQVFANPDSTIEQKQQALISVQQKAGLSAQVVKNLTEKADLKVKQEAAETGGVVGKLSTPEALAAPGSQAAIQAQIDNPNKSPKEVTQLRALLPQAAVAQLNAENIKAREARNQQLVNQGTPETAGRLLADRSLTLPELKSRQVTPKFIADAIVAAQTFDPTYKAAEAEAQGRVAASPANAQFFGNTDSLLVKGGTLDQLAKAYAALGNTQIPVINKLDNLRKAAVGSGPLAAAYAAQLGVADDYSKVISGGGGSDSSRQQALDIMAVNLSPEGQAAAINQIRQTIESQRNGRVGTNPYMKDMYPDPVTRQETPGQAGTQAATAKAPSGKAVSLKAAMALPINAGKTADQVRADIQAHGHQVGE
jgi:hypothetical protein